MLRYLIPSLGIRYLGVNTFGREKCSTFGREKFPTKKNANLEFFPVTNSTNASFFPKLLLNYGHFYNGVYSTFGRAEYENKLFKIEVQNKVLYLLTTKSTVNTLIKMPVVQYKFRKKRGVSGKFQICVFFCRKIFTTKSTEFFTTKNIHS